MGVDFYCGDVTFGCSYGYWNDIRIEIIKATFAYIQDKHEKDNESYGDVPEDGKGSNYYVYMKDLIEMKSKVLSPQIPEMFIPMQMSVLDLFVKTCNFNCVNALNKFGVGGLFALCNKSDCEGYYTPGNALDICELFNRVKSFVQKGEYYSSIYDEEGGIYEVFECSYKTLNNVVIS